MPSGCTELNRFQRGLNPKLGQHAKQAAYATAALNACPLPDAAWVKGPYWVFQQLVPIWGLPGVWALHPSERMPSSKPLLPSSFIMCLILAFLSCSPSPSPSSVHTACFCTPSLCPPLLLMFDKRKCAMPDKHIPVPNSLGLF